MKPIVEYTDFRLYMQDYYEERKRCSAFSWREFSKVAGFSSCSYMKVVCDGKSNLSRIGVERVGMAMGLEGFEMDYFRAMVAFGQETREDKKKSFYEQMKSMARLHKVRIIEEDVFAFYDSWKNPVLRELAPMMPGATPKELAKKCIPYTSAMDVRESLDFLVKNKFLKESADGYEQSEKAVVGSSTATRLAIRSMHREMGELAVKSLDLPKEDRNFTGVTMGVSKSSYEKIVKELEECRRKIVAIANDDKDIDQVYRLNLQLFPLTYNAKVDDEKI